jgi:hypothetical protein
MRYDPLEEAQCLDWEGFVFSHEPTGKWPGSRIVFIPAYGRDDEDLDEDGEEWESD